MSGICGFTGQDADREQKLAVMLSPIRHRGAARAEQILFEETALGLTRPDDQEAAPALVEGQLALVFDGALTNAGQLRAQLEQEGYLPQTGSDAELVLQGYQLYGRNVVEHLRGSYAFVLWEEKGKHLLAARDPFGTRPLYYTAWRDQLIFASEIRSILAFPGVERRLNRPALEQYLAFGFNALEETFFRGIFRLLPGSRLYWEKRTLQTDAWFDPLPRPMDRGEDLFIAKLDGALREAIARRTGEQDETGVLLQGNVDDELLAALFSGQKLYSIGYAGPADGKEGGRRAAAGAEQVLAGEQGLSVRSRYVTPEEYFARAPRVMAALDEPCEAPEAVTLSFACEAAAPEVKSLLCALGARELLGGKEAYYRRGRRRRGGDGAGPEGEVFSKARRRKLLKEPVAGLEPGALPREALERAKQLDAPGKMQYIDLKSTLPEAQLQVADRMSALYGVTLRYPYLDRGVWSVARRLPLRERVRRAQSMYVLRRVAAAYLHGSGLWRERAADAPMAAWLRTEPCYEQVLQVFSSNTARRFFHVEELFLLMQEHWSGKRDNSRGIWTIYAFLLWYEAAFQEER